MRRRELVRGIAGSAIFWPLNVLAQQRSPARRVAVLMGTVQSAQDEGYVSTLLLRLAELGWRVGVNLQADVRWWKDGPDQMEPVIAELLASSPDVVVVFTNLALAVLRPLAGNTPIVFVGVGDPIGDGFVSSLAHPGGTITGFTSHDASMGGKWLQMLKEGCPSLARVMAILHAETPVHRAFWQSLADAAPHFGIEATPAGVHGAAEIENAIVSYATTENAGIVVFPHAVTLVNRDLIIALSLRYRLPAMYAALGAARAGALFSYSVDWEESFRRTAEYVDRVLRGERPGDLPVQEPTKFKLAANLKTARAIGVTVPDPFVIRADEVIE
jgi:putative tryptophan/tyrosine transport system substrate-binding protein